MRSQQHLASAYRADRDLYARDAGPEFRHHRRRYQQGLGKNILRFLTPFTPITSRSPTARRR